MGNLIEHENIPELEETIVDSHRAYEGSFLHVDAVDIVLPDGAKTTHEVIRHSGAVGIVALDRQGNILMVRQYRTSLERVTLEIPAGRLEPGEDPEECARRELSEETGYVVGRMEYLAPIAPAAGYSDEIIHLFMATELAPGAAHPDEGEFVTSEWIPLDVLIDSVLDKRIEDSKTVIAALICDALRHRM